MTTTTKTFLIVNRITCQNLGFFLAATADDAVIAMICEAGYHGAEHEAEVLQSSVEKLRDELRVTEVDVPEAAAKLAAAMVVADRESGDCDDVLADDTATGSGHWDRSGLASIADDAGIDREVARALAGDSDLRAAYAAAWRQAVEADLAE
jgi:hypothetical protein